MTSNLLQAMEQMEERLVQFISTNGVGPACGSDPQCTVDVESSGAVRFAWNQVIVITIKIFIL